MNVLSLDIETYGAAKSNHIGLLLPKQTAFHPKKSQYLDNVANENMVLTVAVTLPTTQISQTLNFKSLSSLDPGSTLVFQMHKREHKEMLKAWIKQADVILGMNLQFDIQYLRFIGIDIPPTKNLVDLSVLNYLHSELREERSLKSLGPILGTHAYSETLKTSRFKKATDEKLLSYNAQDTHNTMLAIAELSKRLLKEKFDNSNEFGEYSLSFYSQSIWATIVMSENGVPMSSLKLQQLFEKLDIKAEEAVNQAKQYDLILQGEGSALSKDKFLDEVIRLIEQTSDPDIMDKLDVTPKTKKVSFTKKNRTTLLEYLPDDDESSDYRKALGLANDHAEALKIISSYCYPLLYHRRNKPEDMSSVIIPLNYIPLPIHKPEEVTLFTTPGERVDAAAKDMSLFVKNRMTHRFSGMRVTRKADAVAYPTWYVTPSHIKNDTGSAGGTIQGRITCKQPSAQTFPKIIKSCIRSRYDGGKIVAMDLSQAELRVAALLSGETSMINAYNEGRDLHAERARTLWGDYDQSEKLQHQRRQVGKMMNFADLFLSSANAMKEQVYAQSNGDIDIPLSFYQDVVKLRKKVRPQLSNWQLSLLHKAKVDHRIMLPLTGQSRTFFGDLGKSRSEIVNFPVQTTAGNVTLAIQHALFPRLELCERMFLQIYDAIYIECPKDHVQSVQDKVNDAVDEVVTQGYWSKLEEFYGRSVTLKHDMEVWD